MSSIGFERAYEKGFFSDITIIAFHRTYKLHKVIIQQSPYFSKLLINEKTGHPLDITDDCISLDIESNSRITKEAFEITLRDMYTQKRRESLITPPNALHVLCTSSLLEWTELSDYTFNFILSTLSPNTLFLYAHLLDSCLRSQPLATTTNTNTSSTKTTKFNDSQNVKSLLTLLQSSILSYMVQNANKALNNEKNQTCLNTTEPNNGTATVPPNFFSNMPIFWIRRVLECDVLTVTDEFERYTLVKRVALHRRIKKRSEVHLDSSSGVESCLDSNDHGIGSSSINKRAAVSSVFGRLFGSTSSSTSSSSNCGGGSRNSESSDGEQHVSKKIKREVYNDEDDVKGVVGLNGVELKSGVTGGSGGGGMVGGIYGLLNLYGELGGAQSLEEEAEDAIFESIFQTGVVYTYMTFSQLEIVRSDRIVNDSIVLQSFWMQTELSNKLNRQRCHHVSSTGIPPNLSSFQFKDGKKQLPPFRFAAKFKNVRHFFTSLNRFNSNGIELGLGEDGASPDNDNSEMIMMISEACKCAGVDYRVLLGLETVEPTQKSIPGGSLNGSDSEKEFVLKAHLQRHRVSTSADGVTGSGSGGRGEGGGISYTIYVFDVNDFDYQGNERWKEFHKPLTACDFECQGHVKGFPLPRDDDGDIWLIVKIELEETIVIS